MRSYLEDMEKKGLFTRICNGAVCEFSDPDFTVMLNAGTTMLLTFKKFPAEYNLNIVTNFIAIAFEASSNPNYNVILVGRTVNTKHQGKAARKISPKKSII